jgi:hypothetical protein
VDQVINGTELVTETDEIAAADTGTGEGDAPKKQIFWGKLTLGLWGGGSYNTYGSQLSAAGHVAGQSQGFSGEGGVSLEFRIFRLLGLQGEAVFTHDTFKAVKLIPQPSKNADDRSTDQFNAMSLMFPLLLKVPLDIGNFIVSPYGGAYYIMPIGEMALEGADRTYPYVVDPPLGLMLGVDAGVRLGPGELFMDLRFGRDIGTTMIQGGQGIQYSRTRLGLSLGYRFILWQRRR